MKKYSRQLGILLILASGLSFWQCSTNSPTTPDQIWHKEETRTTNVVIEGAPAIRLQNYYGGFIIYGHSHENRINISATCRAETPDRKNLNDMLSAITIHTSQKEDTVYLNITAPVANRYEKYRCGLNLFIPYAMPVFIDYSKNSIITNELDSLVYVRRAQTRVLVGRHRGSADIEAFSDINLELYKIWPHAFINAVTDSGDVNMVFPEDSDVTILARSFYHPIELINFELSTYLRSYYTAEGVLGNGAAPINLQTTYGTIRLKTD